MKRSMMILGILLLAGILSMASWAAPVPGDRLQNLPDSKLDLLLPEAGVLGPEALAATKLVPSLRGAEGRQEVIVRLRTAAVGELAAPLKAAAVARAHKNLLETKQLDFVDRCAKVAPGVKVLGRVQMVLNAVFLEVDAKSLLAIAKDPEVLRIAPVRNYEKALSQTVPQIGADIVQAAGFDGSGVSIAVLDSGIDYTHANLGGPGTLAAYAAAYGASTADPLNTTRDGLFPTAKVVEGYDFVGEQWPSGPLVPDEDPIDFDGHGSHVADIAAGLGGVAPGADLYAVKVCSAIGPSCSGVALIQGMDFAVDPDDDGDPSDHVDIINMSLGAIYGQAFDDDLSQAVENATNGFGILTVAAAGNGSDIPYIAATPGNAPTALSVAQTQVASVLSVQAMTVLQPAADAGDYLAIFQSWSVPLAATIQGPVQFGDGAGGNLLGCNPFAAGSLAGKIVYVDRGTCNFTLKIKNIGDAGGVLGIIGTVDATPPFNGGDGGDGPITIPGFMISNVDANILRTGNAVVRFDPSNLILFNAGMVSSSSRGPAYNSSALKPEIGAPGGAFSAEAGTGDGETQFGGTSGATPHVAGSAALLLDARAGANLSPLDLKAILMGSADPDVVNVLGGADAAVSRIGGGEVRVADAASVAAAAWDADVPTGGLGFGFADLADSNKIKLVKDLRVKNYSAAAVKYDITPTFRFANDAATGAVSFQIAPQELLIQPGETRNVQVEMSIDAALLPANVMNSGAGGGDPALLTFNEFDGYLVFEGSDPTPDAQAFTVPWHFLPRQAARVEAERTELDFGGGNVDVIGLDNTGVGTAQNDSYSLLGLSPDIPRGGAGLQSPTPDLRAFGVQTFGGFPGCGDYILAFGLTTWERQSMSHFPGAFAIFLDTDQDGSNDYLVQNGRLADFGITGDPRNVSAVFDLVNGGGSFFFFTENATNSANTALYICAVQIGNVPFFSPIDATVTVNDVYYGGPGDALPTVTFAPLGERYFTGAPFGSLNDIPGGASDTMTVFDFGPAGTNPNELGLLVFTNGDRGGASRGGATADTEALIFTAPGVVVP